MIKILVMDVDGTLTDGKIYIGNDGESFKAFDIKDGCGIHDLLKPNSIEPVIITGRKSKILENRAKEIGIEYLFQGVSNKIEKLNEVIEEKKIELSNVAYIGDDINDLTCIKNVISAGGLTACPYDAVDDVKSMVNYICKRKGGYGAVRDFIEWIIKDNKKEKMSKKVDAVIELVKQHDINSLPIGRYDLSDGSYFTVQEYITKNEHACKLESHKNYVDVHWVVKGKEKIKSFSIDKLEPEMPYDFENDVAFWKPVDDMMEMQLCDGSYSVLYPNDAHMTCIMVGCQDLVRKIVIKVCIPFQR